MSELHEIDGIIFGGEKYTVGASGEVPEGLIDPMDIEWVGDGGFRGGQLEGISPVGIPVKLPDIDSEGNYITTISSYDFEDIAKVLSGVILPSHLESVPSSLFDGGQLKFVEFGNHLTSIESSAFRNNQLTSVVIPDSVTSIEFWAFDDNPLEEVSIGPNTTYDSDSFPSSAVITVRDEEEDITEPVE